MKTQFLNLALRQMLTEQESAIIPKTSTPEYQYPETRDLVKRVNDAAELFTRKGESAFKEFETSDRWRQGDNYIFVLDTEGNMLSHPDPALKGRKQWNLQDINGKYIIRGIIESAISLPDYRSGWYHYQWPVPGGLVPMWKSTFSRLVEFPDGKKYIIGSGIYNDRMERAFVTDMVMHAVAEIETYGDAAFAKLRDPGGVFRAKDAYVFVTDLNGVELVNPAFPNLEGRNLLSLKDTNGKELNREMILLIKTQGSGWCDYMWPKPGHSASAKKSAYVHAAKYGNQTFMVGCGVYLEESVQEYKPITKTTAEEVIDLVRKAALLLQKDGEKAYPLFREKGSQWFRDDTYLFIFTVDGLRTFHASEPETENVNAIDLKDIHNRPIVRMMIDVVSSPAAEGWVHYMYTQPDQLFPTWKSSFVKKVTFPSGKNYIVGCGIYNMQMNKFFIEDLVNKAASIVATKGPEAFATLRDKTGPFYFMDTYVFVQKTDGTEIVNPAHPGLEGRNLMDVKDREGKAIIKDEIALALAEGSAWLDMYWYKPGQKEQSLKRTFVRKVEFKGETFIIGSGLYPETEQLALNAEIRKMDWKTIPEEKLNEMISRRVIHADKSTLTRMTAKKGTVITGHFHPNEELLFLLSGSLTYHAGGKEIEVKAGETVVVPADMSHAITVNEDALFLIFFAPRRDDWIRGEDQYLRMSGKEKVGK